ncbi:hypothetical protein ACLESD_30005 [Pyxidicoccus sp. 3LFB2]
MMKALKMGLLGLALGAAAAVGASTLGTAEEASAPLCCSKCDAQYSSCMASCGSNISCQVGCGENFDRCDTSCFRGC